MMRTKKRFGSFCLQRTEMNVMPTLIVQNKLYGTVTKTAITIVKYYEKIHAERYK